MGAKVEPTFARLSKAQKPLQHLENSALAALVSRRHGRYIERDFDPDEPRDEYGRWTDGGGSDGPESGGGSAGGVGAPASAPAPAIGASAAKLSGAYASRSPTDAERSRSVVGVWSLDAHGVADAQQLGITPQSYHELSGAGAGRFHDAISAAKSGPYAAAVHVYPADDYSHMRLFMSPDSQSGFALKGDDIVSVFKNPRSSAEGVANSVLALATQQGGRRLDAFDTVLPGFYSDSGFRAVARIGWNDEYKPPGWSYETFKKHNGGRPDVVFMVYDPAHAKAYRAGDGKMVADYDAGTAAQQAALKQKAIEISALWPIVRSASMRHLTIEQRFAIERAKAMRTLARLGVRDFDEGKHPRVPAGSPDGGQFAPGGDGGGAAHEKPKPDDAAKPTGGKKPKTMADFAKDNVGVDDSTQRDPDKQKKFLDSWNANVGEDPGEFRDQFLGGLKGTMRIDYDASGDSLTISGSLLNENDRRNGEYTRVINLARKTADSQYFKLFAGNQQYGTGKTLLAANVAMYQKLGLDRVNVHADIDVGGYAWAKYGYVPTRSSWNDLSTELESKIQNMSSGGGSFGASSWDEMSDSQQQRAQNAFVRQTADEFYDSEVDNWRESGSALDDAKVDIVQDDRNRDWLSDAIGSLHEKRDEEGKPAWPFTDAQILDAVELDYDSNGDGSGDLTVNFNDRALTKPIDFDPAQHTLPGIEPVEPHELLTENMRNGLQVAIERAFEREAERRAADIEPPDHLRDSVAEYQRDYWESMRDRDRFKWVQENASEIIGDEEAGGSGEIPEDEAAPLLDLARASDPKALWAIADSKWGKDLLLGSDWYGAIDLHDKATMDRFNAYVGKGKAAAAA